MAPDSEPAACPDCGAVLGAGGRVGCDAAFHELLARAAADFRFAYRRRAVVDAYALQHPAYILSLKSFAVHLCGLCAAVERTHDPRAERSTWNSLRVPPGSVKPPLPGRAPPGLNVASVGAAATPEAFRAAVDSWVNDVWSAWREHHRLAREWLDYAIRVGHRSRH